MNGLEKGFPFCSNPDREPYARAAIAMSWGPEIGLSLPGGS
jgi:hypothetical protein